MLMNIIFPSFASSFSIFREQLSQNGKKTAQELSGCVVCYLQIGSVWLYLTRVHIPGPPFANHFVPSVIPIYPIANVPLLLGRSQHTFLGKRK